MQSLSRCEMPCLDWKRANPSQTDPSLNTLVNHQDEPNTSGHKRVLSTSRGSRRGCGRSRHPDRWQREVDERMARSARVRGIAGGLRSSLLLGATIALVGCNVVGPASIKSGRGVYNEVINKTEDEQILNMIVRQRYGETFGMLSVASVTANVSVSAKAGSEFRAWGSGADTAGNIVPLSAGIAYEENPTISYVPRAGDKHATRTMSPMTLDDLTMIGDAAMDRGLWLHEAIGSVNGIVNTGVTGNVPSQDFDRFIELSDRLFQTHVLGIGKVAASGDSPEVYFVLEDYKDHEEDVRAYLELLGITEVPVDGKAIRLPVRWSLGNRAADAIDIRPRSSYQVFRSVGAMIEVPPPHLEAGLVQPMTRVVPEPRLITIRSSEKRPKDAVVAVRFRDWWFYIDATDARSKNGFQLLRLLIDLQYVDTGAQQAPVITIPAG